MTIQFAFTTSPITRDFADRLLDLSVAVFGDDDRLDGSWRLQNMPDLSSFTATSNDRLVGFKLGYAATSKRYYSWLGGVHPDFRRLGIALALMERQHEWVASRGYQVIETEVSQANHGMAQLNEQVGFVPAGFRFDAERPRVIYRKYLAGAP